MGAKTLAVFKIAGDEQTALGPSAWQSLHRYGLTHGAQNEVPKRVAHCKQYFGWFFRMGQDTTIEARCAM
jgi:hypothetical protein